MIFNEGDVVIKAVEQDWTLMQQIPEEFQESCWDDHDIALACVKQDWKCLEVAAEVDWRVSKELWEDADIVIEAIRQDVEACLKMSKDLWAETEVAIAVCRQDWTMLKKAPRSFQKEHFAKRSGSRRCRAGHRGNE